MLLSLLLAITSASAQDPCNPPPSGLEDLATIFSLLYEYTDTEVLPADPGGFCPDDLGSPIDMADVDHVDLCQVVTDIVDITSPKWRTEPQLSGRHVEVELDLQPVPPILSQGSAWEEILSNLIFNAVDAMPEGGTISLSTRLDGDGDTASIRVADTGTGMDEETHLRALLHDQG